MILTEIKRAKELGHKIGFTASTFDFLHAGHALMLEESKIHCDYLVVGLMTDPTIDRPTTKMKPVQTTLERWLQVTSLTHVDLAIPLDTERDLINIIKIIKPDIRFVGDEYNGKEFTGKNLGVDIYYNDRSHDYSSSLIKEKLKK